MTPVFLFHIIYNIGIFNLMLNIVTSLVPLPRNRYKVTESCLTRGRMK